MSPEQVNLQEKKHKLKENMKNSIILYGKNMFSFSMHLCIPMQLIIWQSLYFIFQPLSRIHRISFTVSSKLWISKWYQTLPMRGRNREYSFKFDLACVHVTGLALLTLSMVLKCEPTWVCSACCRSCRFVFCLVWNCTTGQMNPGLPNWLRNAGWL